MEKALKVLWKATVVLKGKMVKTLNPLDSASNNVIVADLEVNTVRLYISILKLILKFSIGGSRRGYNNRGDGYGGKPRANAPMQGNTFFDPRYGNMVATPYGYVPQQQM
jgi:hypothetical protein